MNKRLKQIFTLLKYSIIKSFITSKKAVGFIKAFKLPILVSRNTKIILKGTIKIESEKIFFGMVKVGEKRFSTIPANKRTLLFIEENSKVFFSANNYFSRGSVIRCGKNAEIAFGRDFWSNVNCIIWSKSLIKFGNGILLGWNVTIRNFDGHKLIIDEKIINKSIPLYVGNHVWICSHSSIIKGGRIDDNCVVGYGALVTGDLIGENAIFAGNPAKQIKNNIKWEL